MGNVQSPRKIQTGDAVMDTASPKPCVGNAQRASP